MKTNEQDQPAKILIVDDEPQITRVLRTALSTQGYSMRIAADGVEGMEAVHAWKPDLVITDVSMPQMNGVELCRELRAISQIPIIVLSVRNQDLMKIEALDAGADLDRKSTRLNSSHQIISYPLFSLKKKKKLNYTALDSLTT